MASSSVSSTTGKNLLLIDLLNSNLAIIDKSMITNRPPITSYSTIGTDTSSIMLQVTSRTRPESNDVSSYSVSSTSTPSDSVSSTSTPSDSIPSTSTPSDSLSSTTPSDSVLSTTPSDSVSSTTPSDSVPSVNTLSSSASQMSISISTSASTLSAPLDGNNTGTIILPVAISLVLIIVILVIALLVTICILVSYHKRANRTLPITSNENKLTKPDIDAMYQPGNTNGQLAASNAIYSDGKS